MNKFSVRLSLALMLASIAFLIPMFSASAAEVNALERLKEGNKRYVNSNTVCHEDWSAKRTAQVKNQFPFAIILSCADSRVPPEIVFDQALGSLFVIRVAGNVVDEFAIGSIEYGVNVLGANLILVLGHSGCGAVDAAVRGLKFDNHIQGILNEIQPAVNAVKGESGNILEKATKANVRNMEDKLRRSKPVLGNLIDKGSLQVVGAYYDLETGKVEFFDKP